MEAYWNTPNEPITVQIHQAAVAAALRAAADQVVPEPPMIVAGGRSYEEAWTVTAHDDVRRRFLAIAAELEGSDA